jgi:ParB family chromosome partitioning protein
MEAQHRINAAQARVDELQAEIGKPVEIAIAAIVEVPGRKRRLTAGQFAELKDNLARNQLVHPVTVRPFPNGTFEVVSGHNRVQAYRELGRTKIRATFDDSEADRLDLLAFYSNLLSPSLPDFGKYLGFSARKAATGMDQKALAEEAGVSESQLSMLFAFDRLPAEARAALLDAPDRSRLGARAAAEIAQYVKPATAEAITSVIKRLVTDDKFTQKDAVAVIQRKTGTPKARSLVAERVIRDGKRQFCTVTQRNGIVAVRFRDTVAAAQWEKRIASFISDSLKSTPSE